MSHRIRPCSLTCLVLFAPIVLAADGSYPVDESKLPEWVKRQGDGPYRAILESSTVHIRAPGRAASAAKRNAASSPTFARAASAPREEVSAVPVVKAQAAASTPAVRESTAITATATAFEATPKSIPASSLATHAPVETAAANLREAAHPVAAPAALGIGAVCPVQSVPKMPNAAVEQGISGTVRARLSIEGGIVRAVTMLSGPPVFFPAIRTAMKAYRCQAADKPVVVEQEFVFETE